MSEIPNNKIDWRNVPGVTFTQESERVIREAKKGRRATKAWQAAEVFGLTEADYRAKGFIRVRDWWKGKFGSEDAAQDWIHEHVSEKLGVRHGRVAKCEGYVPYLIYDEKELTRAWKRYRNNARNSRTQILRYYMPTEEAMEALGNPRPEGTRAVLLRAGVRSRWLPCPGKRGTMKVWNRVDVAKVAARHAEYNGTQVPRGWKNFSWLRTMMDMPRTMLQHYVQDGVCKTIKSGNGTNVKQLFVEPHAPAKILAMLLGRVVDALETVIKHVEFTCEQMKKNK